LMMSISTTICLSTFEHLCQYQDNFKWHPHQTVYTFTHW